MKRFILSLVALAALVGAWSCAATQSSEIDDVGASSSSSGNGNSGAGAGNIGGGLVFGGHGPGGNGNASICKVPPDSDDAVVPNCDDVAPPDSFDPVQQWSWTAPPPKDPTAMMTGSYTTPLVGNFTDDDNNGEIDLCDVPDIIVGAIETFAFDLNSPIMLTSQVTMHLLSGDDGHEHFSFQAAVDGFVYPAFGDIDNDGLPELVTADAAGRIIAFEHDGSVKWLGDVGGYRSHFSAAQCTTTAIYDLDGDGTPEIILGYEVFNAQGKRLWGVPGNAAEHEGSYWCVTPTAADLDGDGKLEVLFGHQTYHHDGKLYWQIAGQPPSHPHVADLDADGLPEVFLTNMNGYMLVQHDGQISYGPVRPSGEPASPNCWGKPAVVHDFNGDGKADVAASTCTTYAVFQMMPGGMQAQWNANVQDQSGLATATAFDFLGDAVAEAIYADETQIFVFDGVTGQQAMTAPRSSGTLIEFPVVADVDNDGSAEIVYVSNYQSPDSGPTLVVLRDGQDRWIPSRRIWNQYSYHVTNVREDGTIPAKMKNSWQHLNTFRTNAQIGADGECVPDPPN